MAEHLICETWHDDFGTRLNLTCDHASCLVELVLPLSRHQHVRIDVLQRPRDSRGVAVGRFWLPPGLNGKTARNCFFRVVPIVGANESE